MKSNQLIAKFVDTISTLNDEGKSIPGIIMSSPGAGKTSSMELYAKAKDMNLVTLIASQYSSDDILGIQSVQNNELVRLNPSWFNHLLNLSSNGKKTILFIDEITTCDEFIQAPLLNLIFNKSLGSRNLPDNCFIIAAGNYSEELNGAFSMTAPMANRFELLNLYESDYSLEEVISNTFDELKESDYSSYLGIDYCKKPLYDFDKFKEWAKKNLKFTPSVITNNREEGLLSFCSIRSLDNSLKFAKMYMSHFNDDDWIRIVGDSLGKFKSDEDWLPLRNKIADNKLKFMVDTVKKKTRDFFTVLHDYMAEYNKFMEGEYNYEPDSSELESLLDINKLTTNEVRVFTKAFASYPKTSTPGKIFDKFTNASTDMGS